MLVPSNLKCKFIYMRPWFSYDKTILENAIWKYVKKIKKIYLLTRHVSYYISTSFFNRTKICIRRILISPSDKIYCLSFKEDDSPISSCFAMTKKKSRDQSGLFPQCPIIYSCPIICCPIQNYKWKGLKDANFGQWPQTH